MGKHLIDLDENALTAAQAELGTPTIKETVNEALRKSGKGRKEKVEKAFELLARMKFADRSDAWR